MGPALTAKAHAEIEGLTQKMVFPRLRFYTLTTDFTPLLRFVLDLLYATGFLSYYIVQELPLFVKLLIKRISVQFSSVRERAASTHRGVYSRESNVSHFKSGALTDWPFFD